MPEENDATPKQNAAFLEILQRQAEERRDLKKKHDKMRNGIPKKDRVGRQRFQEDAFEEEKRLIHEHEIERTQNGITEEDVVRQLVHLDLSNESGNKAPSNTHGEGQNDGRGESKAARRRRKRAEQEAESKRRIAEEKATMGPSAKSVELNAINKQLKQKNMRIHPIAADGHCLFNAIANQMHVVQLSSHICPSVDGLRQATADYLLAHKSEYMPFIETVHGDEEKFQKYCEELRSTAAWGGQVELEVLAKLLNAIIEVYAADLPVVRMGADNNSEETPVLRVSFHRQYLGLGEHYNSIVPQDI